MLHEIYERWRQQGLASISTVAASFYAPILVCPPADWTAANHRVVFVGQETAGWEWTKDQGNEHGYEWNYHDIYSLKDFFDSNSGVKALTHGYELFDFATERRQTRRSPFWQYFRQVKEEVERQGSTSILFTNVIRCSAASDDGYTLWTLPGADRKAFLDWQHGLLKAELLALDPTMVIFVTGPNYDDYLRSEFQDLRLSPVESYEPRTLARLETSNLSAPSYRTYHPGYLNRSLGFAPLSAAINDALQARSVGSTGDL